MGLFGGFRAKFTKDSTAKSASKTSKKSEVVCLGYRVYSEFQEPPQYSQPLPSIRKRPSGVKTVPTKVEITRNGLEQVQGGPSTSTPVETMIVTNPKVKKSTKSLTRTPVTQLVQDTRHDASEPSESKTHEVEVPNGTSVELRTQKSNEKLESAQTETYVVGKTSSFNPLSTSASTNHMNRIEIKDKEVTKSILKSQSAFKLSQTTNRASDTNSISVDSENEATVLRKQVITHQSTEYSSATTQISQIAPTDNNNVYNAAYGYSQSSRALGNTSSNAANIFFGGDEEPEIQRPRKLHLDEVEGANSRSAEC